MNDGTIKIGTELLQDGLKSGLSGVGSLVKGAGMMTIGAVGAIGAAVGAGVKAGIDYNAEIENYVTNFGVMLGSQEAAADKVLELKEMAAKTPFAMSDLASGTQTLLAFGIASEDTTGYLKMLGDISLGDAEKFNSLTLAFGQMSSAGKLNGQDLMQMINAGFNPLQVISEQTGQSMADLKVQMEAGAISSQMVADAFASATSEGGQFYNGMEAASKTFDGQMSTLKDNAMSLVGEVVSPISDSLTGDLLPRAIGAIDGLTEAFRTGGMDGLVEEAGNVLGDVVTMIAEKAPEFMELVGSLVTSLVKTLRTQSPLLTSAVTSVMTQLLQLILEAVPEIMVLGVELLTGLVTGLASQAGQLTDTIKTAIVTIVTAITDNLPEMLSAGIQVLLAVIDGIAQALPEILPAIATCIGEMVLAVVENLPMIIESGLGILVALIEGLTTAIPLLTEYIPTIVDTFLQVIIENLPTIQEASYELIIALIDGIIAMIPTIIETVIDLVDVIFDTITETDWTTLGGQITAGMQKGFSDGVASLVESILGACDQMSSAVTGFWEIESPSKKMRRYGAHLPGGMALGVEDSAPEAVNAIDDLGIEVDAASESLVQNAQQEAFDLSNASVPVYVKKDLSINGGVKEESIVSHRFPEPLTVKGVDENGEEVIDKVIEAAQVERWFSGK